MHETHAEDGSVTEWIKHMKSGDPNATRRLWHRYFAEAVRLAERKLNAGKSCGGADAEDIALSAFASLYYGACDDNFQRLQDRKDLRTILAMIIGRKVVDHLTRERAKKRGGGMTVNESTFIEDKERGNVAGLDGLPEAGMDPSLKVIVAEECDRLLMMLPDDELRQIVLWRVDGLTREEIARSLGCSRRTVSTKLDLIRQTWMSEQSA